MIVSKRIRTLDIAKGLAMICIIIGHMGIGAIDRVVYTFHVPLFFLIAGYFASDSQSLWEVTKKKARTLLVPYCLTCIVIILLGTLYGWHRGDAVTALRDWSFASLYGSGAYYGKPFEIKAIGAIWFLWALFWACIFMRILLRSSFSKVRESHPGIAQRSHGSLLFGGSPYLGLLYQGLSEVLAGVL